ncbi:DUF6221 family protein [Arthrobacter sp. YN]|uniref:DUF6221 family protein n=1 Tax=Arthrobacter sp. YN TaxID=2020486 RepID=UPI000B5F31A4|nr:DUF6221 family protein [Arthrobacter sp. YN]ASN20719.1 hypothetical protein CGK93_14280 [Arthrobacter sp. YN]
MSDLEDSTKPIVEFLLARIAEDDAAAQAAADSPSRAGPYWGNTFREVFGLRLAPVGTTVASSYADHIARNNPARVLAECAAKRRVIELTDDVAWLDSALTSEMGGKDEGSADSILYALAAVYSDHPDYRKEWA